MIFAGTGPGRTGSRKFPESPDKDAWGPRAGFAYRLGDRNAIRGGYGIYYSGVAFGQGGLPTVGFQANLLAPNLSNGVSPAFYLDDGFPQNRVTYPALHRPGLRQRHRTARGDPEWIDLAALAELVRDVPAPAQRQHDAGPVVHREPRHPPAPQCPTLGVDANMNDPSVLALGATVLQSNINSAAAQAAGIRLPYPGFTGNVAQALRKYPQYQNIAWRGVPVGESKYHALETVLERRFSRGLQARVAYTFSKLHNNGSENAQGSDGANATVQNPADPLEWSLSADDTPHVFLVGFTWEVPGSESWSSGVAKALLGGWNVSGVLRYESGRPFNITDGQRSWRLPLQ